MSVFDKFLTEFLGFDQTSNEKSQVAPETRDIKSKPRQQGISIVEKLGEMEETQNRSPKVLPMERSTGILNVMYPESYEETKRVCDSLKAGIAVIINLEQIENSLAQRIIDFLSGTVYTLKGSISKLSDRIFVVTPEGYKIDDERQDSPKPAENRIKSYAN